MKGYLSSRHVLIKTISVGRSNANRVERVNRVIRDFLNRRGLNWSDPSTIYDLSLYLNTMTNIQRSNKYGNLTPFELRNGYVPDVPRFINCRRPNCDYFPKQTHVRYGDLAEERRVIQEKDVYLTFDPKKYYIGRPVYYRRGGRKDGRLSHAVIHLTLIHI